MSARPIDNRFATPEECQRFEQFLAWLTRRGRRPSTLRSYTSDWQALTIWYRRDAGRPFGAAAIDATLIGRWRAAVENKGKSASTVLRRMAFARTYGKWLTSEGLLERAELAEVRDEARLSRPDRGPQILDATEVCALLAQVDARGCRRDQAIVYTLLDTGVRVSELAALDVGDLDFARGELWVRGRPDRRVVLPTRTARKLAWSLGERGLLALPADGEIVLPATGGWPPSERVAPPDPRALPALCDTPPSPMPFGVEGPPTGWPLFVGERGRLSVNGVQRVVRKHAAFARVEASPQVLRHTFALDLYRRTRDLVSLAEALGNDSIESGRVYAHVVEREGEAGEVEAVGA